MGLAWESAGGGAVDLASLYGWVTPPAIGTWTTDIGTIDESGADNAAVYVGRNRGASQRWAGKAVAVADVAWRLEVAMYGDPGRKLCGHAIVMMSPSGTEFYSHGRYMDDTSGATYGRSLSFCWTSATASPTTPTWATDGTYEDAPDLTTPHEFAVQRAVGGALTIQVRTSGSTKWNTIGTHANDTTAIGLTTRIGRIGFGVYAADPSGTSRIHRGYLASWSLVTS